MKHFTLIFAIVALCGNSFGQSLGDAKQAFYYHKYETAEEQLQRLVKDNPDNVEAVYWLGQTMLQQDDSVAAESLYKEKLITHSDAALLLAGQGELELMKGNQEEAKKLFESALEKSEQKDVEVFHAVARANVDAASGDAKYALEKLNAIPKRKRRDQKNADTYLLMGQAYRKLVDGGGAVTAFNQALSMSPSLAEAKYQIGKVYLTQNNPDVFLPAFEEAIQLDPKFAPAYYELFYYWYNKDINKARAYFDRYLAVSDKDASTQYDKISIIYASRDYATAIDSAKNVIAARGDKADPRYYKLIAYSYDELKDSANAHKYLGEYFNHQNRENLVAQDYAFRARTLSKFAGNEALVDSSYMMAVELDTALTGKQKIMQEAAETAGKSKNFTMQANWLGKLYAITKEPTNRDLYNWGYAHYQARNFVTADSIFCNIYTQKYPDEIFGYLWCARAAGAQDTTMERGTAVQPYKNLIAFARASGEREDYKSTLIQAHGYLASYYANVAKDKDSAVAYLQNILKLDPDNESATRYIEILTKPTPAPAPKKTKVPADRKKD